MRVRMYAYVYMCVARARPYDATTTKGVRMCVCVCVCVCVLFEYVCCESAAVRHAIHRRGCLPCRYVSLASEVRTWCGTQACCCCFCADTSDAGFIWWAVGVGQARAVGAGECVREGWKGEGGRERGRERGSEGRSEVREKGGGEGLPACTPRACDTLSPVSASPPIVARCGASQSWQRAVRRSML